MWKIEPSYWINHYYLLGQRNKESKLVTPLSTTRTITQFLVVIGVGWMQSLIRSDTIRMISSRKEKPINPLILGPPKLNDERPFSPVLPLPALLLPWKRDRERGPSLKYQIQRLPDFKSKSENQILPGPREGDKLTMAHRWSSGWCSPSSFLIS